MLWLGSATAVTRLLDLGSSLVILSLLQREEMGTAALVLSTGAVVEAASGLGLGQALIQAKNLTQNEEQSLFWWTAGFGALLAMVLLIIAPWVADFYGLPVLSPMIALTGIKMVLVGTAVVPQQLLSKHLMFREAGAAQTLATLGEACAKISLALVGFGAWALVLGNVFRGVVLLGAVLLLTRFRPRAHFAWTEVKRYQGFGIRVSLAAFFVHSYRNADYFLIGKFLGVEALGVYRVAFDLGMQPMEVIYTLINRVSYPIYVKLSHDLEALRSALLRSTRSLMLLGAPIVAFLFFAAGDVLALVTHGRWQAAVPAIQILVWAALLRGAAHLFPQIYVAVGRPSYAVLDSAVSLVVLVGAFCLGLILFPSSGTLSVCWAWLAAYPPLLALHLKLTGRITRIRIGEYLRALAPGLIGALLMGGPMALTVFLDLHAGSPLLSVVIWLISGAVVYALYLRFALKIALRDLIPKKQVLPAA